MNSSPMPRCLPPVPTPRCGSWYGQTCSLKSLSGLRRGPASSITTLSPPSASTLAAVPPPAPDPMMQTSYTLPGGLIWNIEPPKCGYSRNGAKARGTRFPGDRSHHIRPGDAAGMAGGGTKLGGKNSPETSKGRRSGMRRPFPFAVRAGSRRAVSPFPSRRVSGSYREAAPAARGEPAGERAPRSAGAEEAEAPRAAVELPDEAPPEAEVQAAGKAPDARSDEAEVQAADTAPGDRWNEAAGLAVDRGRARLDEAA